MKQIQRYVSRELTHFVGKALPRDEQYDLLVHIVRTGRLGAQEGLPIVLTVDRTGSICENNMFSPQVVCFCDIPPADLGLHMAKYSPFGLAFEKSFLVHRGASPVLYFARNSTVSEAESRCRYFEIMLNEYHHLMVYLQSTVMRSGDFELSRRFTDVARFLDFGLFSFMKFFDDSLPDEHPDNFYMEREWRILGTVPFSLTDVERVILPRTYASRFRADLPDYQGQVTFSD